MALCGTVTESPSGKIPTGEIPIAIQSFLNIAGIQSVWIIGLYNEHIAIVNDTSRVVNE